MKTTLLATSVALILLGGCSDSATTTDTNLTRDTSAIFPHSFALQTLTQESLEISNLSISKAATADSSITRIDELLAGDLPLNDVFTPELLYAHSEDAQCYGPSLLYKDHPDSATPNSGELPTGDLGIWTINEGSTSQACTAAQLDAQMNGVKERTMSGLFLLASSLDALYDAGLSLPAVGSSVDITPYMPTIADVTFTSVTLEQTSAGEYQYSIAFTYTRFGNDYDIEFQTTHRSGATSDEYSGLMAYQIQDTRNGGNCGVGDHNVTRKGSLIYERVSSDVFAVDAREADFCSHSMSSGFDSNGTLDATDTYDALSNPDGWGNDYNRFISNYKASNLSGQYSYVWQAGFGDSHSRALQIDLNDHTPVDGESYFSFAAPVYDTSATFGESLGMICNWAAPGSTNTLQPYAQREFLEFNSTTNFFETSEGASNITYAPTNDCTYVGDATFEYDRDLDSSLTSSDIAVVKVGASGSTELEFDLFSYTGSTVAEMIENRGAHLPVAPTW